jgi:ATP-dependent RNA helicase DeaD
LNFSDMNLGHGLVEALRRMDVVEPTPIQEAAILPMIEGRDIVGQARTGSGKTLAFSIPLLSLCDPALKSPQALILVPTRELAGQVGRVVDKVGPTRGLRAAQIYGGRDMGIQVALLNTGPQIIIGTPGRVLDHLYRGSLSLRDLRVLVLDEADQMLDQGFAEDVDRILDCAPGKVQMALFSATVPDWVHEVISHRLEDPVHVEVDQAQLGPNECIDHTVIEVPANRRLEALRALLEERGNGNVLIFARTKIGVERLGRQVGSMGFNVAALQGNLSQPQRERILRGFRRGNPPVLVATNVAARGLDILAIEQVINFEIPESAELLTHRLGRTGRMGRHGSAITLLTPADIRKWKAIEKQIGVRVRRERFTEHGFEPEGEIPGAAGPLEHTLEPKPEPQPQRHTRSASERHRQEQPGGSRQSRRVKSVVNCATCQKETTVSFIPRGDRPVYCNSCFKERREGTAA